jgi:hypothetical protein
MMMNDLQNGNGNGTGYQSGAEEIASQEEPDRGEGKSASEDN